MGYKTRKSLHSNAHKKLVNLLREKRRLADITQAELSNIVGWPQTDISKLERGERRLDVVEFITFAEALNLDPHKILDEVIAAKDV